MAGEVPLTGGDLLRMRMSAFYALHFYLPFSGSARALRKLGKRLRGKPEGAPARLPATGWNVVFASRPIRLAETGRAFGNVNLSELAVLALAAAAVPPGTEIVEIGTFDGRTTLNLALNAQPGVQIVTLDLPPDQKTAMAVDVSEQRFIDKPSSGDRFRACAANLEPYAARIRQVFGDSARYDWSPHLGRCGLVFVDGSHAYDYVRADSETALRLVRPGGTVVWHDYSVWPGVTRALDELEDERRLGLRQIRGTSLVAWRAP